jgi:nucleoside-triphosphatase
MKHLIFLTGAPRTGKTTVLQEVALRLEIKGYTLGGMISQEIREKGTRVGFEIRDYTSNRKGWLAHIHQPVGPRIGKYRVNLEDLDSIGVAAILTALKDADIVLIDEIGPMELLSEKFENAVQQVLNSSKLAIGTIHYKDYHSLVKQIKSRKDTDIVKVTLENRTHLPFLITNKAIKLRSTQN